jgi:hypothetical protein
VHLVAMPFPAMPRAGGREDRCAYETEPFVTER